MQIDPETPAVLKHIFSNFNLKNPTNEITLETFQSQNYDSNGILTLGDLTNSISNKYDSFPNKMSENYEDGSVYTGEFKVGMRHGKGIFVYSDGGTYEGEWKNGQMDGFGVLFYPNKQKAYEGGWLNDKFHGSGVIFNENIEIDEHIHIDYKDFETIGENWIKYEGFFQDDNKNRMGSLFLKD